MPVGVMITEKNMYFNLEIKIIVRNLSQMEERKVERISMLIYASFIIGNYL